MKQIPLISIYDPLLKDFDCVIRKHLYILSLNKEVKQIFTPSFMVSVRGAKELRMQLVRAKLRPLERSVESFKCSGKQCQVRLNITEPKHFQVLLLRKSIKLTTNLTAMINV